MSFFDKKTTLFNVIIRFLSNYRINDYNCNVITPDKDMFFYIKTKKLI